MNLGVPLFQKQSTMGRESSVTILAARHQAIAQADLSPSARRASIAETRIGVVPVVPRQPDPNRRRYGIKAYSSQEELKQLKKQRWNKNDFKYKVEFTSKQYHLVRNKHASEFGVDDKLELLPNTSKIPVKLPNVKMHLQPDRPPNLANAHDARFENINRDPTILSKVRKPSTVDFEKLPKRETSETLVNKNAVAHMYQINEKHVKKRTNFSFVDISKQKDEKKPGPIIHTHDEGRAS